MPGLSKDAHGLPRYMMDCGWWRNGRKWRRRTLAEMGLMTAMVSFANEHGTDGVLPGDVEELAEAMSLPLKEVRATLPKLVTRKAVRKVDDTEDADIEIIDFLEHNPSRAEVEADRRRKASASARGNHQRWHIEKGVTDPDCEYCSDSNRKPPPGSDGESESDAIGIPNGNAGRSPYGSKEVRMDGRKEGTASSSSSDLHPPFRKTDDDDGPPRWALIEAMRRLKTRPPHLPVVVSPSKWVHDVACDDVWPGWRDEVATWLLETNDDDIAARIARLAEPHEETTAEQGARLRAQRETA